jgi:ketosteroid isomerase-like protein
MKTTLYFGSTLILALLLGGCQQATLESNATFAANSPDWEKAFNEPDKKLGMSLYTDDAMLMPPNAPSMVGKKAIGEMFVGADAAGVSLSLNTTEGFSSGDLGYALGEYTFRAPDGSVADVGKYIEVHKRVNGKWLMHRDIYNSNLPPATPVTDNSTNEKALNAYFDAWNDGYLDSLDEFFAENFQRYSPGGTSDASDLGELRAVMFQFQTAYPDVMVKSDEIYFYDNRATVHWTFSGTNTGPGEAEATGNFVEISGLSSLIFEDGKITEENVVYDNLDFMEQLGYELVLED